MSKIFQLWRPGAGNSQTGSVSRPAGSFRMELHADEDCRGRPPRPPRRRNRRSPAPRPDFRRRNDRNGRSEAVGARARATPGADGATMRSLAICGNLQPGIIRASSAPLCPDPVEAAMLSPYFDADAAISCMPDADAEKRPASRPGRLGQASMQAGDAVQPGLAVGEGAHARQHHPVGGASRRDRPRPRPIAPIPRAARPGLSPWRRIGFRRHVDDGVVSSVSSGCSPSTPFGRGNGRCADRSDGAAQRRARPFEAAFDDMMVISRRRDFRHAASVPPPRRPGTIP